MKSRSLQTLSRFWGKMRNTENPSVCWEWTRGLGTDGYGQLKFRKATTRASRVAWELANAEPVPAGLSVLHHCDNRPCCNPTHLFLGTQQDNIRDMAEKGRAWNPLARANAQKTHCSRGHEYSVENTWREKNGYRHCRTCWQARRRLHDEAEAMALTLAFSGNVPDASALVTSIKEDSDAILALEKAKEIAEDELAAMQTRALQAFNTECDKRDAK